MEKGTGVAKEEMLDATKKMASRNAAPGPDGVPGRIWAETMAIMAPKLRHLFTRCLREGVVWSPSDMVHGEAGPAGPARRSRAPMKVSSAKKSTQSGIHGNVFVVAVCYVA